MCAGQIALSPEGSTVAGRFVSVLKQLILQVIGQFDWHTFLIKLNCHLVRSKIPQAHKKTSSLEERFLSWGLSHKKVKPFLKIIVLIFKTRVSVEGTETSGARCLGPKPGNRTLLPDPSHHLDALALQKS